MKSSTFELRLTGSMKDVFLLSASDQMFFFSNVTKYIKTQLTRDTLISNLIYFSYFRLIHVLKAELELCETLQEFT